MTTATAAIAQHLNILESAIRSVEEWARVLFVRFAAGRPRFVSKKVLGMNNFDLLVSRFCQSGNDPATAKKAALVVIKAARDFRSFNEIKGKFSPNHHDFIEGIMADEQAKAKAEEKALDAIADGYEAQEKEVWQDLESHADAPLSGSPKQCSWARSIRGFAIEREYAPAVASGRMTFDAAVKAIENSSAKFWIDNRKQWGCK